MTAEQWRRARDLFDSALDLPPNRRRAYVRGSAAAEPELLVEVESLLDAHDRSAGQYETGPSGLLPREQPSTPDAGQHIGPWLLLREVGEGGAGIVYAAARDDSSYQKVVALKLLRPDRESREMVRRFRLERQVLASLDHPNIARMLDAGTTPANRPYLVMEYVEGVPIDQWVKSHKLTIPQLLEMFLCVLDAVGYAHSNLVVHCDLKPANILVSSDGVPKLLDFGIAKLLRPEFSPEIAITRAFGRMLTPEYASPEQIRGEPVKISVDVYAMGVLLYRLLTGQPPYEFPTQAMMDIERTICQVEPKLPSAIDKRISGDLEAILMTALRKDVQERYQTVERFSSDIRRYLDGLPVSAHRGGFVYHAQKFVRRNRVSVGVAAAMVVALATAAGVSFHYATVANRRFQQASELTRFVIFQFDDAIRSGQTQARRVLVSEGLEYLKRLSTETGSDPAISRELAAAYLKMGDIQGNPFAQNLGDVRGARKSFEIALERAQSIGDRELVAAARIKLADLDAMGGDRREGLKSYEEALKELKALPSTLANQRQQGETMLKMAWTRAQSGDGFAAQKIYEELIAMMRRMGERNPGDTDTKLLYARSLERAGLNQTELGDSPGGIARLSQASELMDSLAAGNRNNAELARRAFACSMVVAEVLKSAGREDEAEQLVRRALGGAEVRVSRDPSNVLFKRDRYVAMSRLADLLGGRPGGHAEAHQLTKDALEILRPIVSDPDAGDYDLHQYAWLLVRTPFKDLRNPAAAVEAAQRAVQRTNGSEPAILDILAQAQAATGASAKAVETARRALALLPEADASGGKSALRVELEKNLEDFESQNDRTRSVRR